MKNKPITPYQRLLTKFTALNSKIEFPQKKFLWTYPHEKLGSGFTLRDLWDLVATAEMLGWDTILEANEEGIHVSFRKKATATL